MASELSSLKLQTEKQDFWSDVNSAKKIMQEISELQKVSERSILTSEEPEENAYLEKIDNFILKEYSNEQILLQKN